MKNPLRYFADVFTRLVSTWRTRRLYRGWSDVRRAAWLRFAESRIFRRFLVRPGSQCSLRLRDHPDPLHLRRANSDFHVVEEIFERGDYQPVLTFRLPPDARILDLGANIGLAAIYFSIHFPACRILAVEPDADNCDLIRQNAISLLQSARLTVVQGFVAADDGQASLARGSDSWAYHKTDPTGPDRIPCYSIPTLCQQASLHTIDLMKCDVEGTEVELFASCAPWIGRVRHLIVEVHGDYRLSDLYAALKTAGWKFKIASERPPGITFLSRLD